MQGADGGSMSPERSGLGAHIPNYTALTCFLFRAKNQRVIMAINGKGTLDSRYLFSLSFTDA